MVVVGCRQGRLDIPRKLQERRRSKRKLASEAEAEAETECGMLHERSVGCARRRVGLKETAV